MYFKSDNLPLVAVAVYWSSLAVVMLSQALVCICEERDRRGQRATPFQRPDTGVSRAGTTTDKGASSTIRPTKIPKRPEIDCFRREKRLNESRKRKSQRLQGICMDTNRWEVEKLVSKRKIGRTVFYKVKWQGRPESSNSWERKDRIGRKFVAEFETKPTRDLYIRAIPLPYPYGRKPYWPPQYHTNFGRPIRPPWKVVDTQITELVLNSLRTRLPGRD